MIRCTSLSFCLWSGVLPYLLVYMFRCSIPIFLFMIRCTSLSLCLCSGVLPHLLFVIRCSSSSLCSSWCAPPSVCTSSWISTNATTTSKTQTAPPPTTGRPLRIVGLQVAFNPITPESDKYQISPAASPEIQHHTVWRTWLFIAY